MANIQKRGIDTKVSDILEWQKNSAQYMRSNYWDELTEVYRAIKCRTKPIIVKDSNGKEVEDKTKTNVCMPDMNIIWRRNVARMTAQPYRLLHTGGDPMICDMLNAQAMQQYDRSGEAEQDRRVVMAGEFAGFTYSKLSWDRVAPMRKLRRALTKGDQVLFRDRKSIMQSMGAPQDEIEQAVAEMGAEVSDQEVAQFLGKIGNEIQIEQECKKYEGPVVKAVMFSDLFLEPGCLNLNGSDKLVETYTETDLWLQKMLQLTYADEDGNDVPAFDAKACEDLIDMDPGVNADDAKVNDLKQMFRGALSISTPRIEKRLLSRKRFDIFECHEMGDDGRMWTTWVSDKVTEKPLGRMPYPWDLYGKSVYTEMIPLPDMIAAQGDSTPRLLRYIHQLLNSTHQQNYDYVRNLLKKYLLVQGKEDLPDEAIVRSDFRELRVRDIRNVKYLQEPGLPAGAFERSAELRTVMGMAEPSLNNVDGGTDANPMAGKTATTAILNSKASDSLVQFKLIGRDLYLKELGEKKLWMNQQAASESAEIDQKYWGENIKKAMVQGEDGNSPFAEWAKSYESQKTGPDEWAVSSRYGKTSAIRLDPMEIQEDYSVEPEAGSYLSVDDDIRRGAARELVQAAMQAPEVIDQRKVARFYLNTIRGIGNPDDYILPEQPESAAPPMKGNINVSVQFDKLPADVQNQILPLLGMQPSAELEHRDTINGMKQIGEAADAAAKLAEPAVQPTFTTTQEEGRAIAAK